MKPAEQAALTGTEIENAAIAEGTAQSLAEDALEAVVVLPHKPLIARVGLVGPYAARFSPAHGRQIERGELSRSGCHFRLRPA